MISTLEEMAEIPVGEIITVRGSSANDIKTWTALGGNQFQSNVAGTAVTLKADMFAGALSAGFVTKGGGVPRAVGDCLRDNGNQTVYFTVVRDEGDNKYTAVQTDNSYRMQGMVTKEFGPEFVSIGASDHSRAVQTFGEYLLVEQDTKMEAVKSALTEFYEANADDAVADEFDLLLDTLGMGRREEVEVSVTIGGRSEIVPTTGSFDHLPAGMTMPDLKPQVVDWEFPVTATFETKPGTCVCDQYTEEMALLAAPKPHSEMHFTTSCPNC